MYITVHDFLELSTDLSGLRVTIWDLTSEDVVFDSDDHKDEWDIVMEIDFQDFGEYDVESYDLYKDADGRIRLELNIDMGDEDEEDDEE